MKRAILATLVCLAAAEPAKAWPPIPPGGGCCRTCLCLYAPQLLMVPAFFP